MINVKNKPDQIFKWNTLNCTLVTSADQSMKTNELAPFIFFLFSQEISSSSWPTLQKKIKIGLCSSKQSGAFTAHSWTRKKQSVCNKEELLGQFFLPRSLSTFVFNIHVCMYAEWIVEYTTK